MTFVLNSGRKVKVDVPKGLNGYMCMAALRSLRDGKEGPVLVGSEADFVAATVDKLLTENKADDKLAKPVTDSSENTATP